VQKIKELIRQASYGKEAQEKKNQFTLLYPLVQDIKGKLVF